MYELGDCLFHGIKAVIHGAGLFLHFWDLKCLHFLLALANIVLYGWTYCNHFNVYSRKCTFCFNTERSVALSPEETKLVPVRDCMRFMLSVVSWQFAPSLCFTSKGSKVLFIIDGFFSLCSNNTQKVRCLYIDLIWTVPASSTDLTSG